MTDKKDDKTERPASLRLDPIQFDQLDEDLGGILGALNTIKSRVGPADKNKTLHQAITDGFTGLIKAIDAQTKDHGKWEHIQTYAMAEGLAAIALAASTPDDNSPDIEELTARFRKQREALEAAKDSANPPPE